MAEALAEKKDFQTASYLAYCSVTRWKHKQDSPNMASLDFESESSRALWLVEKVSMRVAGTAQKQTPGTETL